MKNSILVLHVLIYCGCFIPYQTIGQSSQNPSPMEEHIRPHERIEEKNLTGKRITINDVLPSPVEVFIPASIRPRDNCRLLIHFFGANFVAEYAVGQQAQPMVLATINLGGGSSNNERPFLSPDTFTNLLEAISAMAKPNKIILEDGVYLSAFSAGYGAVRAILKEKEHVDKVNGILLLDGLHTGYVPDGLPLAQGGKLEIPPLLDFLSFARLAIEGEKKFIFNHSSVFPGTFASTTECADFLIDALALERAPVLRQGPLGMQQVGETVKGKLMINAFAGNSAPDHVDHFHVLYHYLSILIER
jgi:hypothetical protein